jgi:hypothetical protein
VEVPPAPPLVEEPPVVPAPPLVPEPPVVPVPLDAASEPLDTVMVTDVPALAEVPESGVWLITLPSETLLELLYCTFTVNPAL